MYNYFFLQAEAVAGAEAGTRHFPVSPLILLIVGFVAAAGLGSVAWYNSKRPAGWKDKERPDVVPKVDKE